MSMIRWLFFDVGYTLADEDAVWLRRCREQADTPKARQTGLTAETIWQALEEGSRLYLPPYRYAAGKYGFDPVVPYRGEYESLYHLQFTEEA